MDEERGGSDEEASDSNGKAEKEVGAVAGEEGDGTEDDRDLEEGFAEVVAGSLGFCVGDLVVEFVCFLLFGCYLGPPLFDVDFVLFALGAGGCGVEGGQDGEEIDRDREVVHADLLGLILVPLVGGAGLHENRLGVGAVAEDGDHGDEDGKDGDGKGDDFEGLAFAVGSFFELVRKFLNFVGFHVGRF